MKNFTILLLSIIALTKVNAQDISFDLKSTEIYRDKITKRTYGIEALGQNNQYSYYLFNPYRAVFNEISHGSTESHFLGKYDENMNLVKKAEIDLKQKKQEKQFEGVYFLKGKLTLFSSFQNEALKKNYLFVQNINKETLEKEDNIKMIGELDYSGISKYHNTVFQYEVSEDSSKVLAFYTILSKKNEILKFGMYLYDNELNLLWENENVFPKFTEGVFNYKKFKVDNNGNVYLMGMHYEDKQNYYDAAGFKKNGFFSSDTYYADKPNYTYQIYKYSNAGKKEEYADINIPDKFIRSLTFVPDSSKMICCMGIYSAPGTLSAKGSFILNFNISTQGISNLNTKEFSTELVEQGFSEKELNRFRRSIDNKDEWDPFDYALSDIKTRKNGDKYFIAEQFIEGTKKEKSGNMIVYKPIYIHNDAFIVNFTGDNKITRIDKISKRQYLLITSRFNSYLTVEKNNKLYFIFNTMLYRDTMLKNVDLGDTYLVSIDEKGNQRKVILKKEETSMQLIVIPGTAISLTPNSIIYSLMSANFKDYSFEKLTIKE
jgi:hypothetical protein